MFGNLPQSQPLPQNNRLTPTSGQQALFDTAVWLGLIVAILMVYAQVRHFDFSNLDDPRYVTNNAHVKGGLTLEGIKWALTAVVASNWTPVTMLSHMAACQFFGPNGGMHHLMNVLFHAMAALLLYATLYRATGAAGASAFVAFIFGLHPLHVESVAWIAERKDVLGAFFFFLALYAYVRYCELPGLGRYLLVAALFCLGLMSKPMVVTFPFALLLFDVWPLRRASFPKTLWEKLPLIALSALASAVTYWIQGSAGALQDYPFERRIDNLLISYVTYIGQTFWPTRLSWFYPYPVLAPAWQPASAAAVLLGVSALAIFTRAKRPYFLTGWLWYLGTLVPVIGLVQMGAQAHADRYTYIPMVGLLWIVAWGAADAIKKWPRAKPVAAAAAVACCIACMFLARRQAGYWQSDIVLYQHGVDVTEDNEWSRYNLALAQLNLGTRLRDTGHRAEAVKHLEEALRDWPDLPTVHNELGVQFVSMPGRTAEAILQFEAAAEEDPNMLEPHRNLGILLSSDPARLPEAIAHLRAAQSISPDARVQQMLDRLVAAAQGPRP